MIASHIDGRLRVRHVRLRDPDLMGKVLTELKRIPDITKIETNPRTGSLLVLYPPSNETAMALVRQFENEAFDELDESPMLLSRQTVKFVMTVSYISGAVAIVHSKKLHVGLQSIFIGFAAIHLWQNRWSLFK